MDCTQTCHEAHARGQSLPDEGRETELAQQVSDRQAAVAYLEAARLTADVVARERLRRRGAELLWRHPGVPRSGGRHS